MMYRIKNKFIIVLLIINLLALAIFLTDKEISKNENQNLKISQHRNEVFQIDLIKMSLLLLEHHKKIFEGDFIDNQSYLGVVRALSKAMKETKLISLRSYIKEGEQFILTATSATKKAFVGKRYAKYGKVLKSPEALLLKVYESTDDRIFNEGDKIAMSLSFKGKKYLLLAKVPEAMPIQSLDKLTQILQLLQVLIVVFSLFIVFFVYQITKHIFLIDKALNTFFDYILLEGNKKDVQYIAKVSKNELGRLSKNINDNMEKITEKIEKERADKHQDDNTILALVEAINLTHKGNFSQEVKLKASNSKLDTLRKSINKQMLTMDRWLRKEESILAKFLKNDYTQRIEEEGYENQTLAVITNTNKLSEEYSKDLAKRMELFALISQSTKELQAYIENNTYTLEDLLVVMKKVLKKLDGDYKFISGFDNILKVIQRENIYVNKLLDTFAHKYTQSIRLMTEFKNGVFKNEPHKLLDSLNELVQDSSVRDDEKQKELIAKIKEITSDTIVDNSQAKIETLLNLLIDEITKDIRYSLFLIEEKVYELSNTSISRVSSFSEIQESTNTLKEIILKEIKGSEKIETAIREILKASDDIRYSIEDDYRFIGKKDKNKLGI